MKLTNIKTGETLPDDAPIADVQAFYERIYGEGNVIVKGEPGKFFASFVGEEWR